MQNVLMLGSELKRQDAEVVAAVSNGDCRKAYLALRARYGVRRALMAERGAAGLIPMGAPIPASDTSIREVEHRFFTGCLRAG